jgi:hypothetical protein
MCDFIERNKCLEAMCREKYLSGDPCTIKPEDLKRVPGWMQPDKAYEKCLREGFADQGAMSSLPIGFVHCRWMFSRVDNRSVINRFDQVFCPQVTDVSLRKRQS